LGRIEFWVVNLNNLLRQAPTAGEGSRGICRSLAGELWGAAEPAYGFGAARQSSVALMIEADWRSADFATPSADAL
jgi:hypothetical protein